MEVYKLKGYCDRECIVIANGLQSAIQEALKHGLLYEPIVLAEMLSNMVWIADDDMEKSMENLHKGE